MLNNSKVILREKKLSDAANDYAWRIDAELSHLDAAPVLTLSFQKYLAEYARIMRFQSSTRHQMAVDTLDHRHIGNCAYYDISDFRGEAEVGIMIGDKNYWSQGYGADAMTLLVDYVFSNTRLKRVYLKTLDENARAQKCFQKCHFVTYNHMTRDGYRFTLMQFFRKDWQKYQVPVIDQPEMK
jgi:RimJ/RimL family protein N-acetyltransferase